jgi:hypothetical protein
MNVLSGQRIGQVDILLDKDADVNAILWGPLHPERMAEHTFEACTLDMNVRALGPGRFLKKARVNEAVKSA